MNIAVFCSANNNIDPDYFRAAEVLGRWIGANGHTLVYGGGNSGLMECIGYHHKKVTLCNVTGFWDSLIALLNDHQQKGMIRGEYHDYIEIKSIDDFNR